MSDLIERTLDIAESYSYVVETGDNDGPEIKKFLASVGVNRPDYWCAAFVYYCINNAVGSVEAGDINLFVRSADTWTVEKWAKARNALVKEPRRGDAVLFYKEYQQSDQPDAKNFGYYSDPFWAPRHIGFVTRVNGDSFDTIEGNSGSSGDRVQKHHGFSNADKDSARFSYRFIRWAKLADNFTLIVQKTGKVFDTLKIGGKIFCPVRGVGEELGLKVDWDQASKKLFLEKNDITDKAERIGKDLFVPARIFETLPGITVNYNKTERKILISQA